MTFGSSVLLSSSGTSELLVDTSVAVPLVVDRHEYHQAAVTALAGRRSLGLAGHAAFESYAVLTRLRPPNRLSPAAAMRALTQNFPHSRYLGPEATAQLLATLPGFGISGGAVFDALVAAAAREHDLPLATRDLRARNTYVALGVQVEFLG
jgi:predicted nucleic acid-binding protein